MTDPEQKKPTMDPSTPIANLTPSPRYIADNANAGDTLDALFLTRYLVGAEPALREGSLGAVRDDAPLSPPDATVVRVFDHPGGRMTLLEGDGYHVLVKRWAQQSASIQVTAVTPALARTAYEATIAGAAPDTADRPDDIVDVGFWNLGRHSPEHRIRTMHAPDWAEARANYTAAAAAQLDDLFAIDGASVTGRMLLLHGPPGSGKTTLVRVLTRAWRSWCDVDVVLDPEMLFDRVGYLHHVSLENEREGKADRWRLLVLEDCDELIRTNAKNESGQRLSRLLNVTDGLLGQGLQLLIAITTNEDLARLHPAVTRPGRCVAEILVGKLTRTEAIAWLGVPDGVGPNGATLAELYELRGAISRVGAPQQDAPVGVYL